MFNLFYHKRSVWRFLASDEKSLSQTFDRVAAAVERLEDETQSCPWNDFLVKEF